MSIENYIAAFGRARPSNPGAGIGYGLQAKRMQNQERRADQDRQDAQAQQEQRAAVQDREAQEDHMRQLTGTLMSAPQEQRAGIWQGGMQYARDRGWDMDGETDQWDERFLPTLQGQFGVQSKAQPKRERAKDVNGRERYTDTGEPVFPGVEQERPEPERRIQTAADGFKYYTDTGERVFPDAQQPDRGAPAGDNAGKASTEGERTSAGFLMRMKRADTELKTLLDEDREFSPSSSWEAFRGLSNHSASPSYQRYKQAADDWIRAKLRKESGAVIGEEERDREYRNYFPMPGDSQAVIDQKARARGVAEEAMGISAGNSAQDGASASGQPPAPGARRAPDGLWYVEKDGVFYRVTK
ncbi:hypothetical protein [uncultured Microbulbifer sp.]|uniref:hypothetical protein n=1 Tax=uncultured Microbulbifer sp. TaxID=348147 RepID=UPI0026168FE1|nr:hypothetical protein [uncultured Microbulbifer sp.]